MNRINYHHLYYFWQVAKVGKLNQAAESLFVSQSALSMQIKQLEERLQIKLFEKKGRQLQLTKSGKHVFAYAQDIFKKGEELEFQIENGFSEQPQNIRIGMLSTMSRNFVEQFVAPLRNKIGVKYMIHAMSQTQLLNALNDRQLDVGLTNLDVKGTDKQLWQSQLIARQPISIVGPNGLILADEFNKHYLDYPWVLPLEGNPIRESFDRYCAMYQKIPSVIAQTDDMAMLRLLARDNSALTVLPEVVVKDELLSGSLVRYVLLPQSFENFFAVTVKSSSTNQAIHQLIEEVLQQASVN